MFSRLVEEYELVVPTRDVRLYDALIAHRIARFDEAKACFDAFDRFVGEEVERTWAAQLRRFGSIEHQELREWMDLHLPDPDLWTLFWQSAPIVRLTEPRMVRQYLDSQRAVIRRFEVDMDTHPRGYLRDLLHVYERAYAFVHRHVWTRLYGGNESE